MPQVNLSTLSGPDLRRLLDASRGRGDAALSYTILQEMAARREGRGQRGLFLKRRPAESRAIGVDPGDPMEREDDDLPPMPHWRPPSRPEASAAPPPTQRPKPEPTPGPAQRRPRRRKPQPVPTETAPAAVAPVAAVDAEPTPPATPRPLSNWNGDPAPPGDEAAAAEDRDLRFHPPKQERPRAPSQVGGGLVVGFAVGIAAGVALGWWAWRLPGAAPSPPAAPAAAAIHTAALARPPMAPAAAKPEPAPEAPPEPAAGPPSPDLREGPLAPPAAPEVAPAAEGEATEPPPTAPGRPNAETVRTAEAPRADACAAEPTPADRQICADPELRGLQRELRQAYTKALEAHADRALLRQRQLAWASARDTVSDPDRLARLYEQRIRKLNAATAAARQQR
jgi:uncharacterized protein YecT (DUF1311 family)